MNRSDAPGARAHALLGAMSLADKVNLVTGDTAMPTVTYPNYGAAGVVFANPGLCIPALVLNDAAAGVGDMQVKTTAFPDGVTQASTWDPTLLHQYGQVLGDEAFAKGVNVLLGPGADILRDPLNGRGWEYYGEDPFLTGVSVASIIKGIQTLPIVATVKHYAADDEEGTTDNNYGTISNDVDVRTMHEIELPAFAAAVRAGVGAVMCTSAELNKIYGCQNSQYLHNVLDGQLHFGGWVVSDWDAAQSTVASARAGLDMEMPSAMYYGPALETAVQRGEVPMATLNDMVFRILNTMFRRGLFDHVPPEQASAFAANATTPTSLATALKVAEEGTVLLKDADRILPLDGKNKRIAVIGSPAGVAGAPLAQQGYGSAHVPEPGFPAGVVAPLQAITNRAQANQDLVTYDDGDSTADAAAAAQAADVAVVFVSDVSSEGFDRPDLTARAGTCDPVEQTGCTYTGVDEDALVQAVAKANPNTVVVLQNGGPLTMPWLASVKGVLENWYPGQVDGNSIAPILFGDVDPGGHLPETFPKQLQDGPLRTALQYPGVNGQVVHSERLLIGYRWFTAKRIAPLFPFGFGLSYTRFHFSHVKLGARGNAIRVRFTVRNVGSLEGSDVAQVYVGDPRKTGEPPEQLRGFERVNLAPGQRIRITITLGEGAFAYWSTRRRAWRVAPGCYRLLVGDSSASLPLRIRFALGNSPAGSRRRSQSRRPAACK
jgi:beta-glucosidase